MERYIRIAAPAGGGALLISLLVGSFAGVPFGIVLLRALAAGVVFAGMAVGGAVAIARLLPELLASDAGTESAGEQPTPREPRSDEETAGSRLNIVVEDDDESPAAPSAPSPDEQSDDDSVPESEDDSGELVEEVEEQVAEDEQAVMRAAVSEEQDGSSVEIDDTMLDDMPDIGSFAGAFVSAEYGDDEGEEGSTGHSQAGEPSRGSSGTSQKRGDPRNGFSNETIAKALQTFMERDKGS